MVSRAPAKLSEQLVRAPGESQTSPSCRVAAGAVVLFAAAALIFDAMTPQMLSVGLFYVAMVLMGFWFPKPTAVFVIAVIATPLIIVGYWLAIPDNSPAWEAWSNRALAIGTTWLTAFFVWHIRVLEQKLQAQIDIGKELSREMNHRVGNNLQLVASFLRLRSMRSCSEESRRVLEVAGSRVMAIASIQRMLAHSGMTHIVESRAFMTALIRHVGQTLPDSEQLRLTFRADSAELSSSTAIAIGALLVELINNACKHAFGEEMNGTITVTFSASKDTYVVEVEDDGVGIDPAHTGDGFGSQNVTELARLMNGTLTRQPARQSSERPGTKWQLAIPRECR